MTQISIEDIDVGETESPKKPYEERKHVAFLIGSGFSVPCGMPTGKQLNKRVLNILENSTITFDFSGKLVVSTDSKRHLTGSQYEKCMFFCSEAMKEYDKINGFDYEQFYDFINSDGIYAEEYKKLSKPYLSMFIDYNQLVFNTESAYDQMIEYTLRKDRKTEIKEKEEKDENDKFAKYERFTKYLDKLSKEFIIDVFSLNHDLLFESLSCTDWLHDGISDGFHSFRSPFYGELESAGLKYNCRLEEYKAYYNTAIRLYKLHGSLDYLMFKKPDQYGNFRDDKMIKVPYGIAFDKTKKQDNHKLGYIKDWIEYSPDFLSGTRSKVRHYNDIFYKKLFKLFRKNLQKAENLIIIGYGGRDEGINKYILENFDYHNKPSFIVDPYYNNNEGLKKFGDMIGAKPIEKSIEEFEDI